MSNKLEKLREINSQDIFDNPHEYGLPTFEEFRKDPEKYLGRDDDRLAEVSRGGENIREIVQRHIYEIEGYRCKTLEEVERIAANQGIPLRELDYRPQVVPNSGGKCDILVRFVNKNTRARRNDW
jgi:hypothetical protein